MKHKVKMIGLDMDGTLLTTEKRLTEYTRRVLEKALSQGIEVVLSTGRSLTGIPEEILSIPGMKYAVTINGARIIDLRNDEVLYESMLPLETALQILDVIGGYDAIQEAFIDSVCYSDRARLEHASDYFLSPGAVRYVLQSRKPVENVRDVVFQKGVPVDKVNGVFRDVRDKESAYYELLKISGVEIVSSFGTNWEINAEGTDKGKAMLYLGKLLGISRDEIMACGDSMNDLAMLKAVGFGVAMANADLKVKKEADYITASNDEDGVAKAIERFVL